jgi:carbonic anhydrase
MEQNNTTSAIDRPDNDLATGTWSRMLAGNRRFSQGEAEHPWQDKESREQLIDGQHPFATVLSCSDSRVPPEIVFDQGLGDLFTIRTAGEILDEAVVASLEFSVQALHVNLIVIMGHEHCGAVESAIQGLKNGKAEDSDSIVVRQVGASVLAAQDSDLDTTDDYERVHVARTIERLVEQSSVLRDAVAREQIMIVGARYLLSTGKVEVLSF